MHSTADPMLWATFLTITGVWLAALVTPGPDFLATTHAALAGSRRSGVLVAAGVAVGMMAWATASVLGFTTLIRAAPWLYATVKIAGAAYLMYLGIRLLWSARTSHTAVAVVPSGSSLSAFRRGLLTNLSNPKAAALFSSLFAVLTPATAPPLFDAALVGMMVATTAIWYAIVACVIASGPLSTLYRRAERAIAATTGLIFIGLGARLATEE